MRETFVLNDLLSTLILLETKGHDLYTNLMGKQEDERSKQFFSILAGQELNHKKIYETLLAEFEETNGSNEVEKVDEAYRAYIDVLLKGTIDFLNTNCEPKDRAEAFDISVRLEKDTLMFLGEVKKAIAEGAHTAIETIQAEEQKHLQMIYAFWGYTNV